MKATITRYSCMILWISIAQAQITAPTNPITGKVLITTEGISLGTSKEIAKGSSLDFSYDGKRLDISIGTEVAEDIEVAAGMGFQLNGEGCFYMSLTDGIDIGAIRIEGHGEDNKLVKAVPNKNFSTDLELKGEICYNFLNNSVLKFQPLATNYQNILAIPKATASVLDFLQNIDLDFSVTPSIDAGVLIPSSNTEGTPIPSYCMNWEKDAPDAKTPYRLSDTKVSADLQQRLKTQVLFDFELQANIWLYTLLTEPSDKFISEFSISKETKTNTALITITYMDNYQIIYLPFEDKLDQIKEYQEYYAETLYTKLLTNGGVIIGEDSQELLEALALHTDWSYDKFLKMLHIGDNK